MVNTVSFPAAEEEAAVAWLAIDKLSLAEVSDLQDNLRALLEVRDKLDFAISLATEAS